MGCRKCHKNDHKNHEMINKPQKRLLDPPTIWTHLSDDRASFSVGSFICINQPFTHKYVNVHKSPPELLHQYKQTHTHTTMASSAGYPVWFALSTRPNLSLLSDQNETCSPAHQPTSLFNKSVVFRAEITSALTLFVWQQKGIQSARELTKFHPTWKINPKRKPIRQRLKQTFQCHTKRTLS